MSVNHQSFWDSSYWTGRYEKGQTQWDAGAITTPLKEYFDQLEDKNSDILIPGCGNGYEAEYLWNNGFKNVSVVDLSEAPLSNLKNRVQDFPEDQLLHGDFFNLDLSFDLIVEQTFFCSLKPSERSLYVSKMNDLLKPAGKLVGVLFDAELFQDHPPYGGNREEYLSYFEHVFEINKLERCYNSIKPREGRELFINFQKKSQ